MRFHKDNFRHLSRFLDFFVTFRILSSNFLTVNNLLLEFILSVISFQTLSRIFQFHFILVSTPLKLILVSTPLKPILVSTPLKPILVSTPLNLSLSLPPLNLSSSLPALNLSSSLSPLNLSSSLPPPKPILVFIERTLLSGRAGSSCRWVRRSTGARKPSVS